MEHKLWNELLTMLQQWCPLLSMQLYIDQSERQSIFGKFVESNPVKREMVHAFCILIMLIIWLVVDTIILYGFKIGV